MKKIYTILIGIAWLLTLPLWTGCSNDLEGSENEISEKGDYSGTPIPIQLSVNGIESFNRVQTRSEKQSVVFTQPLNKSYDTGYDVVTTIRSIEEPKTRATDEIMVNARYRLLAYKGGISTANFVGKGDYSANETGQVTTIGKQLYLPAGTDYTFVCYSLGKMEEIAAFDSTTLAIQVNQGDDFMTCIQKNIEVSENDLGEFILDNTFVRQCAKVTIEVSATGYMDNEISACAATIQNMNDNQVYWNFGSDTPTLSDTGTSGSASFVWTALNDTLVTSDSRIVLPIAARKISIKFTSLTIGGESFDNSTIQLPDDVAMSPAGNYKIELKLERNFIPVAGYKWAKGNLYKQGNNFLIQASQTEYSNEPLGGYYFDWNTIDIGTGTYNQGDYSEDRDPCIQVLPVGLWRTPSIEEARALVATSEWVEGDVSGTWFGTAPNRIFLPATGVRTAKTPPRVDNEHITGLYSLKDGSQAPRYNSAISIDSYGAYAVDRMPRTSGMQIRCVRK